MEKYLKNLPDVASPQTRNRDCRDYLARGASVTRHQGLDAICRQMADEWPPEGGQASLAYP